MDLKSQLKEVSENSEWPPSVEGVRREAKRIWERPLHRYYTDHSVSHSERIIGILNNLTKGTENSVRLLSITEVYILLAGAYLHDVGMQDERFANGHLEEIRDRHHELTGELIRNNHFKRVGRTLPLGLEGVPVDIVNIIASVAEAHRRIDLSQGKYEEYIYGAETIRPRLLAALLRLADELDIDHRRVHLELLDLMNVPTKSSFFWYLCYYVSGVRIQDGFITVSYRFPAGCEHYPNIIIPLVHSKIEDEFADLREILWQGGIRVVVGNPTRVRYIQGFEHMPDEVQEFALEQCRSGHEQNIIQHSEEIRFLDSFRS